MIHPHTYQAGTENRQTVVSRLDGRKEISSYSQMLQESQLGVCVFGDGRERELCFKPAVWLSGNEENINEGPRYVQTLL